MEPDPPAVRGSLLRPLWDVKSGSWPDTCPANCCLAKCHQKVPSFPPMLGGPPPLLPHTSAQAGLSPQLNPNLQGLWPVEAVGERKTLSALFPQPAPSSSHVWSQPPRRRHAAQQAAGAPAPPPNPGHHSHWAVGVGWGKLSLCAEASSGPSDKGQRMCRKKGQPEGGRDRNSTHPQQPLPTTTSPSAPLVFSRVPSSVETLLYWKLLQPPQQLREVGF